MFQLAQRTRENNGTAHNRIARPEGSFLSHVDNLFDHLMGTFTGDNHNFRDSSRDFVETETDITVRIDAPGFETEDFNIEVKENILRVVAERKVQKEEKTFVERRLARAWELPASVNNEKVEATYRNGVLELRLPKTEQAKWRKIAVTGS